MKLCIASRWSLSLGTLLALVAPPVLGAATSLASRTSEPTGLDPVTSGLTPGMHGTGRGRWNGPDEGLGRLRAITTLGPTSRGSPTFSFDANLARIVPIGPHGPEIEGTLFGEMRRVDLDGGASFDPPVAIVLGGWTQEPDGRGTFLAEILVPTGDADEPLAFAGYVVGSFRTPPPDSGLSDEGVATLRWSVAD